LSDSAPSRATNVDVLLHPNLPDLYRRKVSELERLLNEGTEREEARELIRSMILSAGGLTAVLHGELATILALCTAASGDSPRGSEPVSRWLRG